MKFIVTLIWPKGAFPNADRIESNESIDAPSIYVAYARAVAKWPEHDVFAVAAAARWAFERGHSPARDRAKTLSATPV